MTEPTKVSPESLIPDTPLLAGRSIIIVVGPLELGGSERQALLFARYLKKEQHAEVQIWGTIGEPGRLAVLCDEYGIPWRMISVPWKGTGLELLKNLARFAWQLRSARPDVILPYMSLPSFACNFVWPWTGARFCVWNQRDHGLTRYVSRYEPRAVRNTPIFIANSNYIAGYLVDELHAPAERVRVIHNGVELATPKADSRTWRAQLNVPDDSFLACMVANLHKDKDHVTLLKAWRLVVERAAPRRPILLLAGRFDTTHDALKALAYDLKLDNSVRFLGQVGDVAGLLGAIDLGVFSSRSEGSPNGVLECMAAGLALVCTDIPTLREAMPDEQYAFLAPPDDSAAMANGVLALMNDEALREKLGALNRARVADGFSKEQMCEKMRQTILAGLGGT